MLRKISVIPFVILFFIIGIAMAVYGSNNTQELIGTTINSTFIETLKSNALTEAIRNSGFFTAAFMGASLVVYLIFAAMDFNGSRSRRAKFLTEGILSFILFLLVPICFGIKGYYKIYTIANCEPAVIESKLEERKMNFETKNDGTEYRYYSYVFIGQGIPADENTFYDYDIGDDFYIVSFDTEVYKAFPADVYTLEYPAN